VRFAGRLARLARLAALIPPADPLADLSDEEMARAQEVISARVPMSPEALAYCRKHDLDPEEFRSKPTPEEEAWFARTIEPRLPSYLAFDAAIERWQRRIRQKPRDPRERLACIFPAFAGRLAPQLRIAGPILRAFARGPASAPA
jgi:hypothetical protein